MRPERSRRGSRVLRAVLTVAVFSLLGPLTGGLVTIIGFVAFGFGPISFSDAGMTILAMTIYGLWMAYPIGILPAAGVGALVAALDAFWRETTLPVAAGIGVAAGVLFGLVASPASDNRLFNYLVIASCLVATLLSWWATRPLRRLVA